MAHHGYENPYNTDELEKMVGKLGATKKFPDGKMNDDDEGEIQIGIAEDDGRIILNFGSKPIKWVGLTKEQARDLGELLIKKSK